MDAVTAFLRRVSPADRDLIEAYEAGKARARASQENYQAWLNNEPDPHPVLPEGPEESTLPGLALAIRICAARHADRPGFRPHWKL